MDSDLSATTKPKSGMDFFKSWHFWRPFLGVATGAVAGYLYYYFIGCNSGTCPITSTPWGSIIMGGLLGFLITPSPGKGAQKKQD